jgi:hypothetical protein
MMRNSNRMMNRKSLKRFISTVLLITFLTTACSENISEKDFVIPSSEPAMALTIGWYVPANVITPLVGKDFKPKIVNENNESELALEIISGPEHKGEGIAAGSLKMANLIIPVEISDSFITPDGKTVNNTFVCPLSIVDKSEWLGDQLDSLGFATYTGEITLNVKKSGVKYIVEAKIITANGLIDINGMFEESGKNTESTIAYLTPKKTSSNYYYGKEKMIRMMNGKGNLKLDGQNIISAMQLDHQPYFLKLDTELIWNFDFVK